MFPYGFLSAVFRATVVGGLGIVFGAIIGGIIFGLLATVLAALITSSLEVPRYGTGSEIQVLLASITGLGGALWGMGIGAAAGFLTGVFMVILQRLRTALEYDDHK